MRAPSPPWRDLLDAGRFQEAVDWLVGATDTGPADSAFYKALARGYRGLGKTTEAIAADYAAIALEANSALAFYNLGTLYLQNGGHAAAEKWLRQALKLDPQHLASRQNLAAALESQERGQEAQHERDIAYRQQCFIVEPAQTPKRTVLAIAAPGLGNIPIDGLIPRRTNNRILWFIAYAEDGGAALPDYDLVLNAIGDPDMIGNAAAKLDDFLERCQRPALNRPDAVAATRRDRLGERLAGLAEIVVPKTARLAATPEAIREAGFALPVIIRPFGSHGGKGVDLVTAFRASPDARNDLSYVTQYVDTADSAGFYRKYRVIFVDRQPFPYHQAISRHWLVHYFSADMLAEPWKAEEERRFLEAPATALGTTAWAALAAIGRRLDLDFAGIDFTLLPDGRVLVFEANATMIVHAEDPQSALAHKNAHIQRIFDAFEAMMVHRVLTHEPVPPPS